jgi:hypothetical protein
MCLLLTLFTCRLAAPAPALSQPEELVTVTWELDAPPEGGWTVGDPIPLRLRASYAAGVDLTMPELPGQWGPFEIRDQTSRPPRLDDDGTTEAVLELTVALWAPGEYESPPLAVRYGDADGEDQELLVAPLPITVASLLAEGDLEKRDLKPQASLPRPPVWPWVVLGLLALALLFFALRWSRSYWRRRSRPEESAPVDDRFPEEIAYDELAHIAALDLPAQAEFKRHYTLVTGCLRVYIEGIYGVPALDRTTRELIAALRRAQADRQPLAGLHDLLTQADLVKFAKLRPSVDQARATLTRAREFIDRTKPDRTAADDGGAP